MEASQGEMKVLFACHTPFPFAHGGLQVQIEQTQSAVAAAGVAAEPLRWWDEHQFGSIVHHFGLLSEYVIRLAQHKGYKVILTLLLSQTCNRSSLQLLLRKLLVTATSNLPEWQGIGRHPIWAACHAADHIVVGLEAEKRIVTDIYGVSEKKISTVPLGLSQKFLSAAPANRTGDYLITVGTIAPVKHAAELARMAQEAEVPILFVGKPFRPNDDYWARFFPLIDSRWVRHHPHVDSAEELILLLQNARGFVLNSEYENWSFAAHEAAACGLPVLLRDLPWSRERFGDQAAYFPRGREKAAALRALRTFYEQASALPPPKIAIPSWNDVGQQLKRLYDQLSA